MRAGRWRRLSRFLDDSPLVVASGLTLLCLPAILILAWVFTDREQDQRIESSIARQRAVVERQLDDAQYELEVAFSQTRNVATWVAEEGHVLMAILQPAKVPEVNDFLHRVADTFGIDLIYIMNEKGICVTASNAGTSGSPIGRDYSDREHFQAAIQGRPGHQFAVGRTTKIPGFYFSMPIVHRGKVVGTVGVKIDQPRLMRQTRIPSGMVSDSLGIVVMSENPVDMFKAVPNAIIANVPESTRMYRYARKDFPKLALESAGIRQHPEIYFLDGEPVLLLSKNLPKEGLTAHVFTSFDVLTEAQQDRNTMFASVSVVGAVTVWGMWAAVVFYLRARDYRRRLELVNKQLQRLNDELHEQATYDYLTGCLNRRAFSALLNAELDRLDRYGGEMSLAVLDVDYFKRVNDTRGHATGDVVLQHFAEQLKKQMRRSDVLARIGGEEFALLMPSTPLSEAAQVVDRMRESVAAGKVASIEPPLSITFSAGVTAWRKGVAERGLMHAADRALYEAKGQGRNRVIRAEL